MNKHLHIYVSKRIASRRLVFVLGILFLLPGIARSQKKELTISTRVSNVAVIDHSRLRKEYKEFAMAKEKLAKENKDEKKSVDQALFLLDKKTQDELRLDSLADGKNGEQIIQQASAKRSEILNNYQLSQKKRNQDKITLSQTYELKITSAIALVISEGGFTEIRPIASDSVIQRSVDITNLILGKLN